MPLLNLIIPLAFIGIAFLFVTWADRKRNKEKKRYPSATIKRIDNLDEMEGKISE